MSDLLPSQGGSGSFNLSLVDPFTGRVDTTEPLDFDASANEVTAWHFRPILFRCVLLQCVC